MGDLCLLFFLGGVGWLIYRACSAGAAVVTTVVEKTPDVVIQVAAEAAREAEEAARIAAEQALIEAAADTADSLWDYFFGD